MDQSSPIINFKKVFEQFGEHLKPASPMSDSDGQGESAFSKLVKGNTSEDQSEAERVQKEFMETQRAKSKGYKTTPESKSDETSTDLVMGNKAERQKELSPTYNNYKPAELP